MWKYIQKTVNNKPEELKSCHLSRVTCYLSHEIFFLHLTTNKKIKKNKQIKKDFLLNKLDKVVELVGGGFLINGAFPIFVIDQFEF